MFESAATVAGPVFVMETSAALPAGVTVILQVLLVTNTGTASVALALKEEVPPAPVGVPVTAPVDVFRVKPVGSDPRVIENVYGGVPPVGTKRLLYVAPTTAPGSGQETAVSVASDPVVIGDPGFTIELESNVTAPVRAKALPFSVAPVLMVMDTWARMVPLKIEVVPRVAELPTCQRTLAGFAPLMRTT